MWLIVIYMQTKPTEAGSSFAAVNSWLNCCFDLHFVLDESLPSLLNAIVQPSYSNMSSGQEQDNYSDFFA